LIGMVLALIMPPPEYDHPNKNIHIEWKLPEEVHTACHDEHAAACAFTGVKPCIIFAYHSYRDQDVIRHEVAHCNGWPGDHRGGHYE
jgi:hypothetical protein